MKAEIRTTPCYHSVLTSARPELSLKRNDSPEEKITETRGFFSASSHEGRRENQQSRDINTTSKNSGVEKAENPDLTSLFRREKVLRKEGVQVLNRERGERRKRGSQLIGAAVRV